MLHDITQGVYINVDIKIFQYIYYYIGVQLQCLPCAKQSIEIEYC